jgi:DNA-directed RNA polymerase specialized sigma24 family protein
MPQQRLPADTVSLTDLLAHAAWARRLARGLVSGDPAAAEDTVQDAFLVAVQKPPAVGGALRGWLRTVLAHERWSRMQSDRRRRGP